MTAQEAVEILNREKHRGTTWETFVSDGEVACVRDVDGADYYLEPFEVIAIAEKYEREKPADPKPEPSKAEQLAHKIWLATIGKQRGITE